MHVKQSRAAPAVSAEAIPGELTLTPWQVRATGLMEAASWNQKKSPAEYSLNYSPMDL